MRHLKFILLLVLLLSFVTDGSAQWRAWGGSGSFGRGDDQADAVLVFRFSVKTNNTGTSNNDQFIMPLTGAGINCVVDWGDGSALETVTASVKHTFLGGAGTYSISVTGTLKGWKFANGGDKLKMLDISDWGAFNMSVSQAFWGCSNLTVSATDAPIISTTSLSVVFTTCAKLVGLGDPVLWDVSSVTGFTSMFQQASLFNQDLDSWNMSSATSIAEMFLACPAMSYGFPSWTLTSLTNGALFLSGGTLPTSEYDDTLIGWAGNPNTPSGINIHFGGSQFTGDESDSGTTDGSGATAFKLNAAGENFLTSGVVIGDAVFNTTDGTWARVTNVDSNILLTLDTDIMDNSEDYDIYGSDAAISKSNLIIDDGWTITDGGVAP